LECLSSLEHLADSQIDRV